MFMCCSFNDVDHISDRTASSDRIVLVTNEFESRWVEAIALF